MTYYAGIGSRKVPHDIFEIFQNLASKLETLGWKLRTGDATGSDTAFRWGVKNQNNIEIFSSLHGHQQWAYDEVKTCMPIDRDNFDNWNYYIKGLMARNMMQILGVNGNKPVQFVICYTPSFEYNTSECGGTGYAIRCALKHNIPIYNLLDESVKQNMVDVLNNKMKFFKVDNH